MENLTKEERIGKIKKSLKSKLDALSEQEQGRMERYYNCQDDYSFGGICSQANQESRRRAVQTSELLIEQIENDGHITREVVENCLMDMEGNLVSDRIVNSRYGKAFVDNNNNFVSCAKKQPTFHKKGYKIMRRTRKYKFVFGGLSKKGNIIFKDLELLSETYVDEDNSINIDNYRIFHITFMYGIENKN